MFALRKGKQLLIESALGQNNKHTLVPIGSYYLLRYYLVRGGALVVIVIAVCPTNQVRILLPKDYIFSYMYLLTVMEDIRESLYSRTLIMSVGCAPIWPCYLASFTLYFN